MRYDATLDGINTSHGDTPFVTARENKEKRKISFIEVSVFGCAG